MDISAGILRTASGYTTSPHRTDYGLTGGVYVVSSDIINLSARADMLVTGGKPRLSLSIGAGFGSYMTAAVTPIALLVVLVKNAYATVGRRQRAAASSRQ